ncbi:MAG: hypothetical protein WA188_01845 [Terriglobales bacterium]
MEPFIPEMYEVFKQLEILVPKANPPGEGPPTETIEWAKQVLLRVLPRKFLVGASVAAFQREIHAAWENDESGKRVVVFFPAPDELKIYYERVRENNVVEHHLDPTASPAAISERLRWFFQ